VPGQALTHYRAEGIWSDTVKELVRTNDLVRMSFLQALLTDAGIEHVVLDTHMSITEGSANFIAPRLMVDSDDYSRAKRLLADAGLDVGT
jgi:hypothetical protein